MAFSMSCWVKPSRQADLGLEHDHHVHGIDRVGVGTDLAATDAGDGLLDLGHLQQAAFRDQGIAFGFLQRDGGGHGQVGDDIALHQARGELRAELGKDPDTECQ